MPGERRYDSLYSQNEKEFTYGEGQPDEVVTKIVDHKTSGTAVELGAGEGRNSLFLAEKGFQVTAKDLSQVGIDKLKKFAADKGLNIQAEVADISNLKLEGDFDVFVCTYVLQDLSRDEALGLIKEIQEHTNVDGLNAVAAFTQEGELYQEESGTDKFFLAANELKELYDGWELLGYEEAEGPIRRKREDGSPMVTVKARILARKPQ